MGSYGYVAACHERVFLRICSSALLCTAAKVISLRTKLALALVTLHTVSGQIQISFHSGQKDTGGPEHAEFIAVQLIWLFH